MPYRIGLGAERMKDGFALREDSSVSAQHKWTGCWESGRVKSRGDGGAVTPGEFPAKITQRTPSAKGGRSPQGDALSCEGGAPAAIN